LRLSYELNEHTTLPYRFDVLDYASITASALLAHIDRVGLLIYQKEG
jgi:hypothetical protein